MPVETIRPESSNITEYTYDSERRRLTVIFRNGWRYVHAGVPAEAFANMRKYRSAGEFYHSVIRLYRVYSKEAPPKEPKDANNEGDPAEVGGG